MAHYGGGANHFFTLHSGGAKSFLLLLQGGGEEIFGRVKNSLRCMSRKDLICLTSLIRRHGTNFLGIKIDTVVLRGIMNAIPIHIK